MSTRNFSRRFYVPPHPDSGVISDGTLEIDGPSAHHMINVLRVAPNDQVVLFDGVGCEYEAVVQSVKKSKLVVEVGQASRCLLYTSPSPRDRQKSRMPSSA